MDDKKKNLFIVGTENLGMPEVYVDEKNEDDGFIDDEASDDVRYETAVPEVNFEAVATHKNSKITEDILYIGVNDHDIDLFEGQFDVPNGMAYNSYAIVDDKIAIMDTVDAAFVDKWLLLIDKVLKNRIPDYLVVHHMEPDHSAGIAKFVKKYPDTKIVSSAAAFNMMKGFFGDDFADNKMVIKEGSVLELGKHRLNFIGAPLVHWPEVMFSYEESEHVLFSADGFGKFGALDVDEDWACEARRYYFGIVGKFGANVQAVLKKAAGLDIRVICPLHGPVLKENLGYYLDLYNTWSSYGAETEGVVICYTSVYGNTKKAVDMLAEELENRGIRVAVNDLARCDMAEAVEDAFRYDRIVLATTTYNNEIFPFMRDFIAELTERNFSNKKVGLIENGSWAPMAANVMKKKLEGCKNLTFAENVVKIKCAVNEENKEQIKLLAAEM